MQEITTIQELADNFNIRIAKMENLALAQIHFANALANTIRDTDRSTADRLISAIETNLSKHDTSELEDATLLGLIQTLRHGTPPDLTVV